MIRRATPHENRSKLSSTFTIICFLILLWNSSLYLSRAQQNISPSVSSSDANVNVVGINQPTLPFHTRVSILISTRDDAYIYSIFGHAAVRVQDYEKGTDDVYNYGVFDMSRPGFVTSFISGHIDQYMVCKEPFSTYISEYLYRGSDIYELYLDLPSQTAVDIANYLEWNIKPENMYYLYNEAFDNCATRLYSLLEKHLPNHSIHLSAVPLTWRQAIYDEAKDYPWFIFGLDLAWGSLADKKMTPKEQLFLPTRMYDILKSAYITDNQGGDQKTLVTQIHKYSRLNPGTQPQKTPWWKHPEFLLIIIWMLYACSSFTARRTRSKFVSNLNNFFSSALLLGTAIIGGVLFFLSFCSIHPFTAPNINLLVFHPVHLLAIPSIWGKWKDNKVAKSLRFIIFVSLVVHGISLPLMGINCIILFIDLTLLTVYRNIDRQFCKKEKKNSSPFTI